MVGLFIAAAARARLAKVTCAHCGHVKLVENKPVAHRTCPTCHRHFPDPFAAKRR